MEFLMAIQNIYGESWFEVAILRKVILKTKNYKKSFNEKNKNQDFSILRRIQLKQIIDLDLALKTVYDYYD